ncbi:MAG: hypothetical protein KC591_18140 [Gemmatimonadetes bacterium]|nr:hypothetical protein [Gemmatimonadota bacterium]
MRTPLRPNPNRGIVDAFRPTPTRGLVGAVGSILLPVFAGTLLLAATTRAADEPALPEHWVQPQLGTFDLARKAELRRLPADAPQHDENTEIMAQHRRNYLARRQANGLRGGTGDDHSAHYARGNTLIMHVFINDPLHVWTTPERDEAGAKAASAKDYYLENVNADLANMHFDSEGTENYWYNVVTIPDTLWTDDDVTEQTFETALANLGVSDNDNDGSRIDDYTIGLQFWNGGWDNVIVAFQPDMDGRAFADYTYAYCCQFEDDFWTVWAHEWGHSFGACDEYEEDGECNHGIDCGSCLSTYLDQVYVNGNCTLCSANGCLMKNSFNASELCWYTEHHWARADDDLNGQLNRVKRRLGSTGSLVDVYELWNNGSLYWNSTQAGLVAHVKEPAWTVFGLRSPAGTDYGLEVYLDSNHNYFRASSAYTNTRVNFVVGDYNRNPLSNEHIQVKKWGGASGNYNASFFNSGQELYADGIARAQSWGTGHVARIWDTPLFGGETVTVTLDVTSGSGDFAMALFRSVGQTYFANKAGALWVRDAGGAGATEFYTFQVPADDVYGLVVWSNSETNSNFTIRIGPSPVVLPEETVVSSPDPLRLYQYTSPGNNWSVVGSRPGLGGDISLQYFEDSQYLNLLEESSDGTGIEFVARDQILGTTAHVRVRREIGAVSHDTEWEGGADFSTGYVTDTWLPDHVVKVWDVLLEPGRPYFFRNYHDAEPLPVLNTGLYVFEPGADRIRARSDATAGSSVHGAITGGEWFDFFTSVGGYYGLVQTVAGDDGDDYSIWHGPKVFLSSGLPETEADAVVFASSGVTQQKWVTWSAREENRGGANIWLFSEDSYSDAVAASTGFQGLGVNFVAGDFHHEPTSFIYPRFLRTFGDSEITMHFSQGGTLTYAPGQVLETELPWQNAVAIPFDLYVDGAGRPKDLEISVIDLSGVLELGVALMESDGVDNYRGKTDALAIASATVPGGAAHISHLVTTTDTFGLVIYNKNAESGTYKIVIGDGDAVSAPDVANVPSVLSLSATENPFRNGTALSLSLPQERHARVELFDVAGRRIRNLTDGVLPAGAHRVEWDGRDETGATVGAGVYLARMESRGETRTVKLVRVP